jgi:hypothetical protein
MLNDRRYKALQAVVANIQQADYFISIGPWACSELCKRMLLSDFTMRLRRTNIAGKSLSEIKAPFHGVSFEELSEKLKRCGQSPRSECGRRCSMDKFVAMALKEGEDILRKDLKMI